MTLQAARAKTFSLQKNGQFAEIPPPRNWEVIFLLRLVIAITRLW